MNKLVTHYYKLRNVNKYLKDFFKLLEPIKDNIGCIIFQFPKNFKFNDEIYKRFINLVFMENKFKSKDLINVKTRMVFEFRNTTFFNETMYKLFKLNKWAFVLSHGVNELNFTNSDQFDLNYFKKWIFCSDIIYIRLHGTKGIYHGSYKKKDLLKIVNFIVENESKFINFYIYFNNVDDDIEALHDINNLRKYLKKFNLINIKLN